MLDRIVAWRRPLNLAGFGFCVLLLGGAYTLQWVGGMEPCPLCIFQRVALVGVAVVLLAAALHAPSSRGAAAVYEVLGLATTGAGVALAARHLWLQSLPPDQVPACGPGLEYLMETFALWETVQMVLGGSGECAEVDRVLGITLPAWTLAAFVMLGLWAVIVNWPRQAH